MTSTNYQDPDTIHRDDLRPGLLVASGRDVHKVSNVHDDHFTVQVLLEGGAPPPRTTVRKVSYDNLALLRPATDADVRRVDAHYGPAVGR
jgi:hypothetical protein